MIKLLTNLRRKARLSISKPISSSECLWLTSRACPQLNLQLLIGSPSEHPIASWCNKMRKFLTNTPKIKSKKTLSATDRSQIKLLTNTTRAKVKALVRSSLLQSNLLLSNLLRNRVHHRNQTLTKQPQLQHQQPQEVTRTLSSANRTSRQRQQRPPPTSSNRSAPPMRRWPLLRSRRLSPNKGQWNTQSQSITTIRLWRAIRALLISLRQKPSKQVDSKKVNLPTRVTKINHLIQREESSWWSTWISARRASLSSTASATRALSRPRRISAANTNSDPKQSWKLQVWSRRNWNSLINIKQFPESEASK